MDCIIEEDIIDKKVVLYKYYDSLINILKNNPKKSYNIMLTLYLDHIEKTIDESYLFRNCNNRNDVSDINCHILMLHLEQMKKMYDS